MNDELKKQLAPDKLAKAGFMLLLMIVAGWWCWTVGSSFIHLCTFISHGLGTSVLLEGAALMYVAIVGLTILYLYINIQAHRTKRTKLRRLAWKVCLIWALIPGLNFLLPLAVMFHGILLIGVQGAAFIIVLFETVFKEEEA